jgi:hypothetical protein
VQRAREGQGRLMARRTLDSIAENQLNAAHFAHGFAAAGCETDLPCHFECVSSDPGLGSL